MLDRVRIVVGACVTGILGTALGIMVYASRLSGKLWDPVTAVELTVGFFLFQALGVALVLGFVRQFFVKRRREALAGISAAAVFGAAFGYLVTHRAVHFSTPWAMGSCAIGWAGAAVALLALSRIVRLVFRRS